MASLASLHRDSELFRSLRDPAQLQGKHGRCDFKDVCGGSRARLGHNGQPPRRRALLRLPAAGRVLTCGAYALRSPSPPARHCVQWLAVHKQRLGSRCGVWSCAALIAELHAPNELGYWIPGGRAAAWCARIMLG